MARRAQGEDDVRREIADERHALTSALADLRADLRVGQRVKAIAGGVVAAGVGLTALRAVLKRRRG